jgi:hypothetical protein
MTGSRRALTRARHAAGQHADLQHRARDRRGGIGGQSSGSPTRRATLRAATASAIPGAKPAVMPDCVKPGTTALTRMRSAAWSSASDLVKGMTAPFAVQ